MTSDHDKIDEIIAAIKGCQGDPGLLEILRDGLIKSDSALTVNEIDVLINENYNVTF